MGFRFCAVGFTALFFFWVLCTGAAGQEVRFVDVTAEAGIDFVHFNGASGRKYEVETMGPGCGLFDYDGDGDLDVYLVNGAPLPGYVPPATPVNRLYRNDGGWRFTDVTDVSGTGDPGYGMGCAVGDYDNDGDPDLYVTNWGPNALYRNEGDGTFVDVTARAGVGDDRWGSTAMFFDYDRDGDLDLYLVNYIDWSPETDKICRVPGTTIVGYCHPDVYPGVSDVLYRNEGDGTFTDVTRQAGVYRPNARGLGVVATDYDGDGDPDLYVANDSMENYLFSNLGNGTFEEVALLAGVSFNEMGHAEAGMGVDVADVDANGFPDILVGHLSTETNTLYLNHGDGTFTDASTRTGVGPPSLNDLAFGLVFLDVDNDGDPDAFVGNGHVLDNAELISDRFSYRQFNKLYENVGSGRFVDASARFGPGLRILKSSRGVAAGDIDNDGDMDVLVANVADRPDLLRNEGGNRNSWLTVKVVGGASGRASRKVPLSSRDGVGARVVVVAGELRQVKEVRRTASYQSVNDIRVHFGLGTYERVDLVEVHWPSGRVEQVGKGAVNRVLTVEEGGGRPVGKDGRLDAK